MTTPPTPPAPRLTLKQRRDQQVAQRAQVLQQATAARALAAAPPAKAELAWSFEDEEAAGSDVLSPHALEFLLNLLESVSPGWVNAPNRALLDVARTKIRRGVIRGHGALLLSTEQQAPQADPGARAGELMAGDATSGEQAG